MIGVINLKFQVVTGMKKQGKNFQKWVMALSLL